MTFDNRFFPLYLKPFVRRSYALSHYRIQPFVMRAERARGDFELSSIPDLDGRYDEVVIARALRKAGIINCDPFRSDLQGISSIPWKREGRLDAQGVSFFYEQAITNHFAIGTSFLFMHINARHEFGLDASCIDVRQGDRQFLFNLKEKLHQDLGVVPPLYNKTVFGDFDLYLRFGYDWCYTCKARKISTEFKIGGIFPTSPRVPLNNPAAVPAGGDGHWGIYLDLENQYEVREDWHVGWMFRAIKRFPRTFERHMPVDNEPSKYGAIVGPLDVNPNWTLVFNPYIFFEALREGFGVSLQYTLVAHLTDDLSDERRTIKPSVDLGPVERRSSWGREYVTVGAFYDFAKFKECRWWLPTLSLYWDIPVDWEVSKRSPKTHAISLMVEANF